MPFTLGPWTKAAHGTYFIGTQVSPGGGVTPPSINNHFELADQAVTTTPVMQSPNGIAYGYIVGRQKGFGSGSGTVGPIYELQLAFDSGFTSQVRAVTQYTARRTGIDQTWMQEFVLPDLQTLTFARVVVTLNGTDSVTADFIIDLLPGA